MTLSVISFPASSAGAPGSEHTPLHPAMTNVTRACPIRFMRTSRFRGFDSRGRRSPSHISPFRGYFRPSSCPPGLPVLYPPYPSRPHPRSGRPSRASKYPSQADSEHLPQKHYGDGRRELQNGKWKRRRATTLRGEALRWTHAPAAAAQEERRASPMRSPDAQRPSGPGPRRGDLRRARGLALFVGRAWVSKRDTSRLGSPSLLASGRGPAREIESHTKEGVCADSGGNHAGSA